MPPRTQSLRVLTENGRGRGTHGVLNWPYPTVLDSPAPGRSNASSEETMRADFLASQSSQASHIKHRPDPTPTGKVHTWGYNPVGFYFFA